MGKSFVDARLAIGGNIYRIELLPQTLGERLGGVFFIFDQQQSHNQTVCLTQAKWKLNCLVAGLVLIL